MSFNFNNRMAGTYLVDDVFLLHLNEGTDGFHYDCFDKNTVTHIASGEISWEEMNESPIRGVIASARVLAIEEIGIAGTKVATVPPDLLE